MKNYISTGDIVTVAAPAGGVTSGQGVVVGSIFGVAVTTAAATADVAVQVEGVFDLAKKSGTAFSQGDKVSWDNVHAYADTPASTLYPCGYAVKAAGTSDTTVRVRLIESPTAAA